jgi:molybdopterin-guanine dinucleotide biosynthesis protein A
MATVTVNVQSLLNAASYESYTLDDSSSIGTLAGLHAAREGTNTTWFVVCSGAEVFTGTELLSEIIPQLGTVFQTGNRTDRLATREQRQVAKLTLSSLRRAQRMDARQFYDLDLLPTKYSDDTVIDNPNADGLQLGRPWIE